MTAPSERPAGRPACDARPAGAQARHTRRTVIDLELVRETLAAAEQVGVLAAARRAGVDHSTVYRWRERRELSGGVWPTDEDIATWKRQNAAADVHRAQHRRWQRRTVARGGPLTVDATGTMRRIRALLALGHRYADIAAHTPYKAAFVGALAVGRRRRVNVDTADQVRAVYNRLSMTTGPSQRTRTYARNRGWPPPLAWDDHAIDDPKARPHRTRRERVLDEVAIERAMHGDPVHLRPVERAAAVRQLTDAGHSADDIANRLRTTPRTVTRHRTADPSRRSA